MLSDEEKLRVRFHDAPIEDLDAIIASARSTDLERRIAREMREALATGTPIHVAAAAPPDRPFPVGRLVVVLLGVLTALLSAANTMMHRRRVQTAIYSAQSARSNASSSSPDRSNDGRPAFAPATGRAPMSRAPDR